MSNPVFSGFTEVTHRLFGGYAELLHMPHTARFSIGSVLACMPFPMIGMGGPIGQWVFDRSGMGGPAGLMAFVLSAAGDWEALDDDALAHALHAELETLLGPLPPPRWQRTIRERRATFSCRPDLPRPGPTTAEQGLWLAGDYTYGDYPATIEAAVRSGAIAAHGILAAG